uniref:Uncharacterized protein n=1 Tax=Arundo donax TaxID=35708 RepID=A0A0A9AKE2_ARUDO
MIMAGGRDSDGTAGLK